MHILLITVAREELDYASRLCHSFTYIAIAVNAVTLKHATASKLCTTGFVARNKAKNRSVAILGHEPEDVPAMLADVAVYSWIEPPKAKEHPRSFVELASRDPELFPLADSASEYTFFHRDFLRRKRPSDETRS